LIAISAPALSHKLDRSCADWSPRSLHETFLKHGCAVVRDLIPCDLLRKVQRAIEAAYTKTDGLHVYDPDILKSSAGRFSGFELVDVPLVNDFLPLVYVGQGWTRESVTARRIEGVDQGRGWQNPLGLHLDSHFHRFQFTTNFWIPFEECGVEAPGLQLVPLDYLSTRQYSGFTGSPLRERKRSSADFFNEGIFSPDVVAEKFGPECFYRPIMRPGDAVISSNWLIHGSYRTMEMRRGRTSVEVRFIGDKYDVTIPAQTRA
jgi:hypothetical protein